VELTGPWHDMLVPTLPPWVVVLRAVAVYAFLLVLFRVYGRQEFARNSTFDLAVLLVVTTALRTTLVADDKSLTSGFISLSTLFALDGLASIVTFRSHRARVVLEGRPRVLVRDGKPDPAELRRARLAEPDLVALLRDKGTEDLARVKLATLERSGAITFVLKE
jgi:uncharacterized membrane protein YcaP (DUF421 family)